MQNSRFHRNRLVAPSSVSIDTSIASASVPIDTSIASASVPINTSIASASIPIDTIVLIFLGTPFPDDDSPLFNAVTSPPGVVAMMSDDPIHLLKRTPRHPTRPIVRSLVLMNWL